MPKKSYQFFFKLLALDFNLLNISFFAMNYFKRGTFALSPKYIKIQDLGDVRAERALSFFATDLGSNIDQYTKEFWVILSADFADYTD
jgi:hypothetical protein